MPQRGLTAFCAVIAAILTVAPNFQAEQPSPKEANSAITEVLTKQQTAWNQGDILAFMSGYWDSPDLTFAGTSGVSRGWQAVSARYQKHYPDKATMGHLEFSGLEIRPLGEKAALVLGHWHLQRSSGDIGGVFTLVFQEFPTGWKIIHDHTSEVPSTHP